MRVTPKYSFARCILEVWHIGLGDLRPVSGKLDLRALLGLPLGPAALADIKRSSLTGMGLLIEHARYVSRRVQRVRGAGLASSSDDQISIRPSR